MSRHRKVKLSRSKAVVIAAAGALSVATAAPAAATTGSPQAQQRHGHAAPMPRLTVTGQLTRPFAAAASQDSSHILVQHRLRLTQTQAAIAQRQAAKKRAASGSPRQIAQAMLGSFGWPVVCHEHGTTC